jgi:hypothetical protein
MPRKLASAFESGLADHEENTTGNTTQTLRKL